MKKATSTKINLKGVTTKDILKYSYFDIVHMTDAELRAYGSRLVSSANKRIRRNKPTDTGVYSPAIMWVAERHKFNLDQGEIPQFSMKAPKGLSSQGKHGFYLGRIMEMREFMEKPTSTSQGFRKLREFTQEKLGDYITKNKERENNYWRAYNRFIDTNKAVLYNQGSDKIQAWLKTYQETSHRKNVDLLYEAMMKEWENKDANGQPIKFPEELFTYYQPKGSKEKHEITEEEMSKFRKGAKELWDKGNL